MIDASATVSCYGYTHPNKAQSRPQKHLMNDLNRRTSQRKRVKVGPSRKQRHKNPEFLFVKSMLINYVNIESRCSEGTPPGTEAIRKKKKLSTFRCTENCCLFPKQKYLKYPQN